MRELYSRRISNPQGEPEVYQYDEFPETFRNQVFYILLDVCEFCEAHGMKAIWEVLHDAFSREIGAKMLYPQYAHPRAKIEGFVDTADNIFLDFIDFVFCAFCKLRDHPEKCVNFRSGCRIEASEWSLRIKSQAQNEEKVLARNGYDKKAGESQPGWQI